ncbi:Holliday junction ATP-dependent DNA helicase RuvB [bioreactor metagenome]|uniref:Replication factor C large subunit n=1 Tax=bioreactor metagenome TaxID=1076179 RepID=A0A644V5P0_9ZZZZ|nr:replication factor C large subunit [Methanobrevibacter sp.]MEA4957374.1 replication factor C large subunit [Methanobrevibacter sp.]
MRWTEKYRPRNFDEIIGNGKQKKEIEAWVKNWKEGNPQQCLLLVGPAGTGKTTFAHVIAREFSDSIELNASDKRSYDIIMNTVGESATTKSFFTNDNDYKLIILDEVDGIHGTDDRGGTRAIGKIIKESIHPIVMTANDFYSKRLTTIKTKCKVIKIGKVHTNSINALLKRICAKEGIKADPEAVRALAKGSNGDMRSALNTLQVIAEETKKLEMDDLEIVSQKDNTNNIFDSVRRVLKSKSIDKVKNSLRLDEDPTLVLEYIAENVPREYEKPKEIKKAYEMISEADLYFGRARQTRNYTYWRYASEFMGVGVALSKDDTYKKFTRLTGAMAFSLMGRTKGKRALRDKIAEKISEKIHVSNSVAISMFPYIEIMFENDDVAYDISTFFDFDDDEIKRFRKKKIPKSVIKRKEKEKQAELAKQKEKANFEEKSEEYVPISSETLSFVSKSNEDSKNFKEAVKKSKITVIEKEEKAIRTNDQKISENLKKEKIKKLKENESKENESKENESKENKSKREELKESSKNKPKKEEKKSKKVKKDSAQKSLFNF